jgi:hypothetical protein
MFPKKLSAKDVEALRVARVRQLFVSGPFEHTESGVLRFDEWLLRPYPHLLPTGIGDPYQHLKADLMGPYK